jgi:Tfp pilus assembly protein PilF
MAYIYGVVSLKGLSQNAERPRVVVTFSDSMQPGSRQTLGRSGHYCFRIQGTGAKIVIEVDGIEAVRKSVSDISFGGHREDFEVFPPQVQRVGSPAVISARPLRPPNDKTVDLYKKAADAASSGQTGKAVVYVKEIVYIDPDDYVAWAKLGSLHMESDEAADAESAFRKSLALKRDYAPALLNLGLMDAVRNRFPEAIEWFKRAVVADPAYAPAYRYLGEAYLQNRQGTMGLAALDEALRLDPVGMAECHLLKARLYDLAGAKNLASQEYKAFLKKVKDHPDRKKFERYVKDNSEKLSD